MRDHAQDRAQAVDSRRAAEADFNAQLDEFNQGLKDAGLDPIDAKSMNSGSSQATVQSLRHQLQDNPEMLSKLDDLDEAAQTQRQARIDQRDAGEAFGEAAGRTAAENDGLQPVLPDRAGAGSGTVDQAYKSPDGKDLVLQETKGPSAGLGTRGGVSQGSEAYLHDILRQDDGLRDAVLNDPTLRQALEDGTGSVRYRLVQPDAAGNVKVTEFTIDSTTLDIPGWLNGD